MQKETNETEDPRDEMKKAQKRFCSWAMTSAIIVAFVFLILDEKAIAKGLIMGTLFSIINFILIGETIPMKVGISQGKAVIFSFASIFLRYVFLSIPLFVSIKFEQFNLAATICGIFMIQLVILMDHLTRLIFLSPRTSKSSGKVPWKT